MSAFNYNELKKHIGHKIVCVGYSKGAISNQETDNPVNVAIECETCYEVLLDFDQPDEYCLECDAPLYLDECGDIFLCELCKEKYNLERLWKDHDANKIDALDFNESEKVRKEYQK